MDFFKIGYSPMAEPYFETIGKRERVLLDDADLTGIGAAVITDNETSYVDKIYGTGFGTPIIVLSTSSQKLGQDVLGKIDHVISIKGNGIIKAYNDRQIEEAALSFEKKITPPFFDAMVKHVENGTEEYSCPGHHGGNFFRQTPIGHKFFDFMGENVFRGDLGHGAALDMNDLLLHNGPVKEAEAMASRIYNSDETYFVLNGTSSSNKVVLSALLAPGDLVLYDRNNHKSVDHGALIFAEAEPVYLEAERNSFGLIGGIPFKCLDESYLRGLIKEKYPERADKKRPFRLAVIEMGTYDGTIYNAQQVVKKIGCLCDYIFFDCAWIGYEQFIPMIQYCSPLLMNLGQNDPGIIVTQSVHKQGAGWSQSSWIHKKDRHIKGQQRYCNDKIFNNAFLLHASTSPFMPMFAGIEVNAKMHEGKQGIKIWERSLEDIIDARKAIFTYCSLIKPFVPPVVHGKPWAEAETKTIAKDIAYWQFEPDAKWHGYSGYAEDQYIVDPMKLQIITPGIDIENDSYKDFGIQANILFSFLRENNITPEKVSLNSLLFLITPAETKAKLDNLIAQLVIFEKLIKEDVSLNDVLPTVYQTYYDRYSRYTICQLCQEMHDFYKKNNVKEIQKNLFLKRYLPKKGISAREAHNALVRGHGELVEIPLIEGRIALDDALPYPPGIATIVSGERWSRMAKEYFMILCEGINRFPGFAPEIQGAFLEKREGGKFQAYSYVLKKKFEEIYINGQESLKHRN